MTIADLNSLERAQFVAAIGWVFERSSWVAERAWETRPFADTQALHRAMVEQVERSLPEEQLALLRAHPDLGTRARVSDASSAEQAGAGLDQLTQAEFRSSASRISFLALPQVEGAQVSAAEVPFTKDGGARANRARDFLASRPVVAEVEAIERIFISRGDRARRTHLGGGAGRVGGLDHG